MKKNILIIDDSALMRRVLSDIINSDDRFQVTGLAVNGLEGLDCLIRNKFDVVVLDINMPKMNGLEMLEQVKKHRIKTKVIIVSTVAKEGANETIRALELGAFDFVTKPESFYETKSEAFKQKLINVIACASNTYRLESSIFNQDSIVKRQRKQDTVSIQTKKKPIIKPNKRGSKVVALACSTGGPKALQAVIPLLPFNLNAPILLVQHMPAGFTNSLANRLNEMSQIAVKEASDGDMVENGNVYIAKGGFQMRVDRQSKEHYITIREEKPRNGLKPCADILYESLVDAGYDEIVCVVLTGMGSDGTSGILKLNENKNIYVIAQDKESSTVYGMPKAIAQTGLVDEVLPLNKVADAIIKYVGVQ